MARTGTLVICVQNLDFSGANQVVLNIVSGKVHGSSVVIISPKIGSFATRFVESGASIRIGDFNNLLNEIRDVFCIICNTIMTANVVCDMSGRSQPVIWILHEWWDDDMIVENLRIRNYEGLTLSTVKQALTKASRVVCVCEAQRKLYRPSAPSSVIFVGVPDPAPRIMSSIPTDCGTPEGKMPTPTRASRLFTVLCLGIICPRKNQVWTVQLFKQFARGRSDVRLQIVGARYSREYETQYLEQVRREAAGDPRIEILDVTEQVDSLYRGADCLLLTSLNEVTPMVISEALSWSLPVLSTNIAGIPEMLSDGVEGFLFAPGDNVSAVSALTRLHGDAALRTAMGRAARLRFETCFDLRIMVREFRDMLQHAAPAVLLLDMDGVLVDWDAGFMRAWGARGVVDRSRSYFMEDCVEPRLRQEAVALMRREGFFRELPPMQGALQALRDMAQLGLQVFICTSPLRDSQFCAQEKIDWVRTHLGEHFLDRLILTHDKSMVKGDLLIDDKPYEQLSPGGRHRAASWQQVLFDAPYNRAQSGPRLLSWRDWRPLVSRLLQQSRSPADPDCQTHLGCMDQLLVALPRAVSPRPQQNEEVPLCAKGPQLRIDQSLKAPNTFSRTTAAPHTE